MPERFDSDKREPDNGEVGFGILEPPVDMSVREVTRRGLHTLYARGYNVHLSDLELLDITCAAYNGAKRIYYAEQNGKAIASLSLRTFSDGPHDLTGQRFWAAVRENDPLFEAEAKAVSPFALHVSGIVTLPEWRGRGLQRQLVGEAFAKVRPPFVSGQSNLLEAVAARASLFAEKGYRTFFGLSEVTPGIDPRSSSRTTDVHAPVLHAYFQVQSDPIIGGAILAVDNPAASLQPPNPRGFSPVIQRAFKPLIYVYERNPNKAFQFPLISIRSDLLV